MKLSLKSLPILLATLACAAAFAAPPATSPAQAPKPKTAQQQRMATCAAQNKGKTGAEYKNAQSACLKGQPVAAAAKTTQQQKMAKCSAQNKGKKGADYKAAQSACLKAS